MVSQIPTGISNTSSLEFISFNANKLSGRIPATIGLHLPKIKGVYLAENQLEGEIHPYITNGSKLETLVLANNFFTSSIPKNLRNNARATRFVSK